MFDVTQLWGSNLEMVGVILGIINVVLLTFAWAPRLQWFNWPAALANAAIYLYLFYEWGLYGNAFLQIPFLAVNLLGLWQWRGQLFGREVVDLVPTTFASKKVFGWAIAFAVLAMIPVYPFLAHIGDPSPLWDGLILTISLSASYLQLKKHVQSWYLWILVDVIAVPFHWTQDHQPTAMLYFIYGVICLYGLFSWWKDTKNGPTNSTPTGDGVDPSDPFGAQGTAMRQVVAINVATTQGAAMTTLL